MMFYRITCRDNGCGMPHDKVPFMLGRVLTGSKYGLRQTRGKFGLGAKMALIWSRKSTGLPIAVTTAHTPTAAAGRKGPPASVTRCVLDIDVHKNEPRVREHVLNKNSGQWKGTEMTVVIGGAWSAYRRRVLQYLQQLAVITPYAQLALAFACPAHPDKSFSYTWRRRSAQLPPPAGEVKHHPASVDQLLVRQLLHQKPDVSLVTFLTTQFQCISRAAAATLVDACRAQAVERAGDLTPDQVHALVRAMGRTTFPPPDGTCLSPAGEYNLRLGILKELAPDFLATHAAPVSVFEGHPFIVEAGVAMGGRTAAEGITVHRFANRIPLLFEGGGDVATRTALQRIPWATYKIDPKRDRIGVFVSIVSTKIPFKGTGKEYVGDDITPMQVAVRSALVACCKQLRGKLQLRRAAKERRDRAKTLTKYIPSVASSVIGVLSAATTAASPASVEATTHSAMLASLAQGKLTQDALQQRLHEAVQASEVWAALEQATDGDGQEPGAAVGLPLHIAPLRLEDKRSGTHLVHPESGLALRLAPGVLQQS